MEALHEKYKATGSIFVALFCGSWCLMNHGSFLSSAWWCFPAFFFGLCLGDGFCSIWVFTTCIWMLCLVSLFWFFCLLCSYVAYSIFTFLYKWISISRASNYRCFLQAKTPVVGGWWILCLGRIHGPKPGHEVRSHRGSTGRGSRDELRSFCLELFVWCFWFFGYFLVFGVFFGILLVFVWWFFGCVSLCCWPKSKLPLDDC